MEAAWRKPVRSAGANNCVEIRLARIVDVRDTKDRAAGHLSLQTYTWAAFLVKVAY
jgi:hypothetical protein